jgi:hypothetical protein
MRRHSTAVICAAWCDGGRRAASDARAATLARLARLDRLHCSNAGTSAAPVGWEASICRTEVRASSAISRASNVDARATSEEYLGRSRKPAFSGELTLFRPFNDSKIWRTGCIVLWGRRVDEIARDSEDARFGVWQAIVITTSGTLPLANRLPTVPSVRSFWTVRFREARGHAILCALLMWSGAIVFAVTGHGYRSIAGPLKGADFVHFYTLGRMTLTGQTDQLYDAAAQYRLQTNLVPDSKGDRFLPVYPPQTALLFAPFSLWSYGTSVLLWAFTTIAVYAWVVSSTWKASRGAIPDGAFVLAAAAAFPPFWNLVLYGQTTIVPLVALYLGWRALERRHAYLAGLAFGMLAIKPQFGLVLAVVVLACGEWAMLAGAVTSVVLQAGVVTFVMGSGVLWDFGAAVRHLPQITGMLEPKAYAMHSIRAVTELLPAWAAMPAWAIISAAVCVRAVRTWRADAPLPIRLGVVVLASVLVNPHLTVYDATVLVLPILWLGAWIEANGRTHPQLRATFWSTVYWLCVTFLMPLAYVIKLQCSVLLMLWMFYNASLLPLLSAHNSNKGN